MNSLEKALKEGSLSSLTKLWDESFARGDEGREIRSRIFVSVGDFSERIGLTRVDPFREFVEDYDEMLFERKRQGRRVNEFLASLAFEGDFRNVKIAIRTGADDLDSALYQTCLSGNQKMAQFLLENGAKDLKRASIGAGESGSEETVNYILSKGGDRKLVVKGAARKGNYWVVKNYNRNYNFLEEAILSGDEETISLFRRDHFPEGKIVAAYISTGRLEPILKYLNGSLPPQFAYYAGKSGDRNTVGFITKRINQPLKEIRQRVAHGALENNHLDLYYEYSPGMNSGEFQFAIRSKNQKIIDKFLDTIDDHDYQTAIVTAAGMGNYELVEKFIPHIRGYAGFALIPAADACHLDVVKLLAKYLTQEELERSLNILDMMVSDTIALDYLEGLLE
jgi:hypothetical protein